jgi:hypothetical protein
MTTLRKLALLASAGLVAAALFACGDDDSGGGGGLDGSVPEGSTSDQFVPMTDGGPKMDSGDGSVDLSSFPKYVKSLIETKTNETGKPDPETVWGAIPDDEKFVYPATFFP